MMPLITVYRCEGCQHRERIGAKGQAARSRPTVAITITSKIPLPAVPLGAPLTHARRSNIVAADGLSGAATAQS